MGKWTEKDYISKDWAGDPMSLTTNRVNFYGRGDGIIDWLPLNEARKMVAEGTAYAMCDRAIQLIFEKEAV